MFPFLEEKGDLKAHDDPSLVFKVGTLIGPKGLILMTVFFFFFFSLLYCSAVYLLNTLIRPCKKDKKQQQQKSHQNIFVQYYERV